MLHKLYRKHTKANSKDSQQAVAVLKAGKVEDNSDSRQKLIASLNRGGLALESYTTCTEDFCQT